MLLIISLVEVAVDATDRAVVAGDPNVVYATETERWQVYDTSGYSVISNGYPVPDSIENIKGIKVAQGEMAYWESASTERYPTNTEIWGDLCNNL